MKSLSYGQQSIDHHDLAAVTAVLRSDYLTQGPQIVEFERQLSAFTGAKYTVVFNSGTAALHAAYFALSLTKGDEIITSPMTFAATTNAAIYLGAKPVFVDINPDTGNIDVSKIEAAINHRTKVLVPIHYGGQPADLMEIKKFAQRHHLSVVDDACHALGAQYKKHLIGDGTYADISIFSFHPVKHITTGEGGAIQTSHKKFYERALIFRTHGITKNHQQFKNMSDGDWYYEMQFLGFNYRMNDISAALGISQLAKLPTFLKRRRQIAASYDKGWQDNPYFELPPRLTNTIHAYHLYPIRLNPPLIPYKNQLFKLLKESAIYPQVHYLPVYRHPYYRAHGFAKVNCPQAELFYQRQLSVPMYPGMDDNDVRRVVRTLLKACRQLVKKI